MRGGCGRARRGAVALVPLLLTGLVGASALQGCEAAERARGADSVLALFAPPDPLTAARWAIDPYDPDRRYEGTLLLANSPFGGGDVYVLLYEDNAGDENPNVRAAGVRGLANHGNPGHVPLLVERLRDESRAVRLEAARALQRLHNPVAVDPLLDVAVLGRGNEGEPDVRAEAAHALGQYAVDRVAFGLVEAMADPDLVVNRNAVRSLRTLTGQDFGYSRAAWSGWLANQASASRFAQRRRYIFPVFYREPRFVERLPFVPPPPNESASTPVGFPPLTSDAFDRPGEGAPERRGSRGGGRQ
ncbi:MAG: HEAT repeat domain-containing protein [Phycisphaerales bacterium]|nr:MAG: HEAT repeat domain-containing protein [Phycisphaerales bacterium]